MSQTEEDLKREVAEIKFLIHDLRVESFINEVIHYHVTVNTDLEIYNVEQAQALHGEDLQELKQKAVVKRKIFQDYSTAVKSTSPYQTILKLGEKYVETIHDLCEMVLDPRWGRVDQLLSFLPPESRSVRSRPQYMNALRWICGVLTRIRHFREERNNEDLYEQFDVSKELQDFVKNVIYGYVTMKSRARVEIQIDKMEPAVLAGNRYRFRRMFFNLVMNAVDAMSDKMVGILNISNELEGERSILRVRDNGSGMPPEKVEQLLKDRESLDGELHSLGFVFVRRTVADFNGELSINSKIDKGTTVTVSLPIKVGAEALPAKHADCEDLDLLHEIDQVRLQGRASFATKVAAPGDVLHDKCGEIVYADYMTSDAQFPGSIFAIGVTEDNKVDFFTHRPYERYWNITHEDLSPMFYEATVRGRVEEDEDQTPALILKAPQNVREYFEFREVPEAERNAAKHVAMVHDEYIRIARKLVETGMSPQIEVRLTDVQKIFPGNEDLSGPEPFSLETLAKQPLNSEAKL
ncbi:MAG: hypothetical protein JSW50_01865 [Candidatus Latescibacterota bacterium]|nr:MAG: hypothetical protein JSW50_01865 [Candidatus Latescibacterota bacterium]